MARLLSCFEGCHTWGRSTEEAMANVREAIDIYVQDLVDAGRFRWIKARLNYRSPPSLSTYDPHPTVFRLASSFAPWKLMASLFNAFAEVIEFFVIPTGAGS